MNEVIVGAFLALIGALLGFTSAIALYEKQRWDARRADRTRSNRVMELLSVEISETRQYLSDRMVMAGKIDPLDRLPAEAKRLGEAWATAEAALQAVTANHAIFDAYIGMIINLPGDLPTQLAQFYMDIGPLTDRLRAARKDNDEFEWEGARIEFLKHAIALQRTLTQMLPASGRSAEVVEACGQ